jgi:hypothetical protein
MVFGYLLAAEEEKVKQEEKIEVKEVNKIIGAGTRL